MNANAQVIYAKESAPDWSAWDPAQVKKLVLGELEGGPYELGALPDDFGASFSELTHLHLWGIAGLEALPSLPEGLRCLDLRDCLELRELPRLPDTLEELILEGNPTLTSLQLDTEYPALWDLSFKNCVELEEADLLEALGRMPKLRHLDLSGCKRLTKIRQWPPTLERIELNHCEQLVALPARWPAKLRRLGLRGAKSLRKLPGFSTWPDYLDLAGTESLSRIDRPNSTRTLYLYGSGLLTPPATEHGRTPTENVAARTLSYYDDVDLCGTGDIKRCKLLMLGNGSAGKTSLSLALVPNQDPRIAKQLGSTHGVLFWDWTRDEVPVGDTFDSVHLQLWDFGGQEIYHQTHQLFMSKGAVFVVVWKPEQDGKQPPPTEEGYQDEWRPLRYWIDFIHMACPWKPRIAIVCSHHSEPTEALEQAWRKQVPEADQEICRCFYIDSLHGTGQMSELTEWLDTSIGEVVETQGTAVPAYWEIAQNMVGSWMPRPDPAKPGDSLPAVYDEMSPKAFRRELQTAIEQTVAADTSGCFHKLREAMQDARFELTEERVRRTLELLTNSGWIYWDPELFESRVIIGQQWALKGIYAALDRREGSPIYRRLRGANGQFTRQDLSTWVWNDAGYNEPQQTLLMSFMVKVGMCFELVSAEDSLWREAVYKSFQHLPLSKELNLQRRFDRCPDSRSERIENDRLHRGHWNSLLQGLGETYGTDAEYAVDGFELVNQEGQHVLLSVDYDPSGFGQAITVSVAGDRADERLAEMVRYVGAFLPAEDPLEQGRSEIAREPGGPKPDFVRLFISYAWNPTPEQIEAGIVEGPVSAEYEAPVRAIAEALRPHQRSIKLLWDRQVVQSGDSVMQYMRQIKSAERILIVHSDKYWRSAYCMFEFCQAWSSFTERDAQVKDTMLFVELPGSGIGKTKTRDAYLEYWERIESIPTILEKGPWKLGDLKRQAEHHLRFALPEVCDVGYKTRRWKPEAAEEIVAWIRSELGLGPKT